jgi:hypothetical protein
MTAKCAECGTDLSTVDVYQHTVACFHLPDVGPTRLLEFAQRTGNQDLVKRVQANLAALSGGGGGA